MRRVLVGAVVPVLLVAAACSGGSTAQAKVGSTASVSVTGPTTSQPQVTFKAPLEFPKTESKIVRAGPGTGPAVTKSSLVTVQYVGYNASDQTQFANSWRTGPSTFFVNSVVSGFTQGLLGAHAGDRVLICVPAKDAFGSTGNLAASVRPGDSVIFVADVTDVAKEQATPPTVPTLQYDSNGNPSKFTADAKTAKSPTKLGVYPIIEGSGPVLKSGQTMTVEYFGQIYPDGDVFNPWNGQPFSAQLGAGQVIPGWEQGLEGQRVGSRVVLVVPPALGYGDKAQSGIPANSTLIFAVQILSAH